MLRRRAFAAVSSSAAHISVGLLSSTTAQSAWRGHVGAPPSTTDKPAAAAGQHQGEAPTSTATDTDDRQHASPPYFGPVRSLLRLGEDVDLIRRCLDSLTPKQLLNVCATCFTLHKQRMRALRDMRDLRRWHVLRRSRCKWRVRSASAQLYILRTRMRGWVAVSDALVVVLIIALCCGFFYFTRALTIYIRRAETVEALSDAMQASIMLLEQHGGDGAKLLNATK